MTRPEPLGPEAVPRLDVLALPLRGSRLVEASAGTGKTWTIAALYLRLVLGHGGEAAAFPRPLRPAEVLVMTFTRAATRELSDRIRARLVEAAGVFRGELAPAKHDTLLPALLRAHEAPGARELAAWRLASAAQAMDDASVMTIDAWCQRMLREHAFDAGCAWDEELQTDESVLRAEAARDAWRQEVVPLRGEALDAALSLWPSVEALARDAGRLAPHVGVATDHAPLGDAIGAALAGRLASLSGIKAGWPARLQRLRDWLVTQWERDDCPLSKSLLQPASSTLRLDLLIRWASTPSDVALPVKAKDLKRLTHEGIRASTKKKHSLELPEDVADLSVLLAAVAGFDDPLQAVRTAAARQVARRLESLKSRAGVVGFQDLQQRLADALDGPGGARLRERIVAQYPAALVDEFQDTSPLQYRLLDRLYRVERDDPQTLLLLIGDPKQSIYAFRGADLRSYLRARHATAGRHSALGTNHRSTEALVRAVNALFAHAESRPGGGAFGFRDAATGADPVPFVPVSARGRGERFVDGAGDVPPVEVAVDATVAGGSAVLVPFAERCADHLVARLDDPAAGFVSEDGFRRLRPGDVAVLVRDRHEAQAVRRALRRRGVASVYLSDKDSVLASPEAADVLRWLRAVAEPLDGRLARAAWATSMAGLSMDELAALRRDDVAFEARVEHLRALHGLWRRQGVLPMLRATLHRLRLPARWLAEPDGERRLTNVMHLAELLQGASAQLEGEQALVRWLARHVSGDETAGDEALMRLESDADLVQVVTVHKSKGLEYPVVYLPFATRFRGAETGRDALVTRPDDASPSGRRAMPGARARSGDAFDLERLQEDLRWLYVALTRPRHALWLGVAATTARAPKKKKERSDCDVERSAFGRLVAGEAGPVAAGALPGLVARAFEAAPDVRVVDTTPPPESPAAAGEPRRLRRAEDRGPLVEAEAFDARIERTWRIGSFSGLVRDLGAEAVASDLADAPPGHDASIGGDRTADDGAEAGSAPVFADVARALQWEELAVEDAISAEVAALAARAGEGGGEPASPSALSSAARSRAPQHRFPRGAMAGNFLHDLLEWLAPQGFSLDASPTLRERLARRCERDGWGARAEDVAAWLARVVSRPLPPFGAPLQALGLARPEMEFWLPAEGGLAGALDAQCRAHLMPGVPRPPLAPRSLRGMLMGFADLVVEHEGRWWVLDYKSNALGDDDAAYHRDALRAAMAGHRYDVQAAIYLLALHRLLRARLGAHYDPARHLGGAVFLFLRGIDGPEAGCVSLQAPVALLDGLDALLAEAEAGAGEGG